MTQASLPFPQGRNGGRRTNLPAPWRRTDTSSLKCHAVYTHPSGWSIEHCGHPTALWPYALYTPDGELVVAGNGRAFRTLELAAARVAEEVQ